VKLGRPQRSRFAAHAAALAALVVLSAVLAAVLPEGFPRPAAAHPEASRVIREIVRIQGHLGATPAGVPVQRDVTLLVLADRYEMKVTDFQVFGTTEAPVGAVEPSEIRVQGDRAKLAELAQVSGQRVTILGERRPGSSEIFLLALDLCPPAVAQP
jgi:hypothetical protein